MPTQNDINSGVLRQRRNVLSISILLILFEVAGGEIESFSTILGTVKIKEPHIIYWAIFLYLIYSLWRYWIYVTPLNPSPLNHKNCPANDSFKREWQKYLGSDPKYKDIAWDIFNKYLSERAKGHSIQKETLSPLLIGNFFKRKFDFSYTLSLDREGNSISIEGAIVSVPFFKVFIVESKSQIKAMIKERCFTDYCLPYFIAFVAILLVVVKRIII